MLKCDCGSQLKESIKIMSNDGGILLYMPEEGRNIGLINKLRAYEFQFHGIDTIDANYALGFDADQRRHENACKLLKGLGVGSIKLITNNPEKISQVQKGGIKVIGTVQIKVKIPAEAKKYLETKKNSFRPQFITIIFLLFQVDHQTILIQPLYVLHQIQLQFYNHCSFP